jgi:SAM-dependent methyltransferase
MPSRLKGRTSIIRSLLPEYSERLLEVGCGPLTSDYSYKDKASCVTCVDWNLQILGSLPANVQCIEGDFTALDLPENRYDAVIAADVFEHILLERERLFVEKCVSTLRSGGRMIISVPHDGSFAFLDPYRIKPAIHCLLARMGLYRSRHNGFCDIRKGHKHYSLEELKERFRPLQLSQVVYYGFVFDPLVSWAVALSRGSRKFPGFQWLERARRRELERDYGERSFNVAVSFFKQ